MMNMEKVQLSAVGELMAGNLYFIVNKLGQNATGGGKVN